RGGTFGAGQLVTLSSSKPGSSIFYTTNGTTPSASSTPYGGPIAVDATTTLKFFAVDATGNASTVVTEVYTIDTVAPTVAAAPKGGALNSAQQVTLTASKTGSSIFYTTDGSTPTASSTP